MVAKTLEVTSYCSFIVYRIETFSKMNTPKKMIHDYVELEKKTGRFPNEIEYVTSFYDKETGSSGSLFKNNILDNYILAYTGTNFYFDREKDMYTDVIGICLAQGEHYSPCYRFYKRMVKKYGDNIVLTGHSLGGNIAMRVALEYNVKESVVYNGAPLYLKDGVDLFMDSETDKELYAERLAKYKRTVNKIAKKEKEFTGNIKRIVSESDIFTRIAELLKIGYYVGDEYIVKDAGMHGIKSFLGVHQDLLSSIVTEESLEDEMLSSDYKDFTLEEVKLIKILSKDLITAIEEQIGNTLSNEKVIENLNKNPYQVDFSKFLVQLQQKLEERKLSLEDN